VVFVEVCQEVVPQLSAQRLLDEADIFPQRGFAKGGAEELAGTCYDVIFKPLAIENW
jgi:hypothetical protein